ncbi:hypothetical protein JS756_01060 [Streptomyces actuosus]|uniref:Uncharacterized protein n=1 Tax=Streptomyces actuosus TaxID=1885 RepID=A0ABS2VI02_STRAS|nr:hypothetical protein [Streptomyces actuosus]MBN0042720.1 hypothetical protein [Streptomyces actuosus]
MKQDADEAASGLKTLVAPHAGRGYDQVIEACRDTAAACSGIRSLTHLTDNTVDFTVRAASAVPFPGALPWDDEVEVEGQPAQRFVRWALEADDTMRQLRTGELMRVLAVTRSGGMQYSRLRDGQYVVGIARTGVESDAMDTAVNKMTTGLRTGHWDQGNEYPGGDHNQVKRMLTEHVPLTVQATTRDKDEENRLRGVWQRHLNPYDLHYAAYYRAWSPVCAGDCFEHSALSEALIAVPAQNRRAMYRDLVFRLNSWLTDLTEILEPVTPDPVERLVLDVQQGAFYLHWLDPAAGDFVVGVTARQRQVHVAEERLGDLIRDMRRH